MMKGNWAVKNLSFYFEKRVIIQSDRDTHRTRERKKSIFIDI